MIGPYICRIIRTMSAHAPGHSFEREKEREREREREKSFILTCAKLRKAMLGLLFSRSDSLSAPVPGQSFVVQCQVAVVADGADLTILIILFTS